MATLAKNGQKAEFNLTPLKNLRITPLLAIILLLNTARPNFMTPNHSTISSFSTATDATYRSLVEHAIEGISQTDFLPGRIH